MSDEDWLPEWEECSLEDLQEQDDEAYPENECPNCGTIADEVAEFDLCGDCFFQASQGDE